MKDSFSEFPSYVERSSPKPKLLLIFVIVLILIVAALAGLYFLGASKNQQIVQSIPTAPTPTPAAAPPTIAPTKPPVLERSELKVAIKNGSGTAGAAKGISSYLNGLGYAIGTIGNADKFTYTGITIHIKKSKSAYLAQLQQDIMDNEPNATISASVDDTITSDAEVIVGK